MFRYVRAQDGDPLPDVGNLKPFKAIVVIENRPSLEWQNQASDWLVESGCLYMMAWGEDCTSWDDSVDWSNIAMFDFGDIPAEEFVMTSWHDSEPLKEVFWFAKECALHPTVKLNNVLILHVGADDKHAKFETMFEKA